MSKNFNPFLPNTLAVQSAIAFWVPVFFFNGFNAFAQFVRQNVLRLSF